MSHLEPSYLRYIFDGLEKGDLHPDNAAALPEGLTALDEAAVAYPSLHISDWFKTYNEKDEPEEDWQSPDFVKWIFTYRKTEGEKGYSLPLYHKLETLPIVQPLEGLSEMAVDVALKKFNVSDDFKKEVVNKGKIA